MVPLGSDTRREICGGGFTVIWMEAVLVCATEVAVTVAIWELETLGGAIYVTEVVVSPESEPGPVRLHVAPLLDESFVSAAMMRIDCP